MLSIVFITFLKQTPRLIVYIILSYTVSSLLQLAANTRTLISLGSKITKMINMYILLMPKSLSTYIWGFEK